MDLGWDFEDRQRSPDRPEEAAAECPKAGVDIAAAFLARCRPTSRWAGTQARHRNEGAANAVSSSASVITANRDLRGPLTPPAQQNIIPPRAASSADSRPTGCLEVLEDDGPRTGKRN